MNPVNLKVKTVFLSERRPSLKKSINDTYTFRGGKMPSKIVKVRSLDDLAKESSDDLVRESGTESYFKKPASIRRAVSSPHLHPMNTFEPECNDYILDTEDNSPEENYSISSKENSSFSSEDNSPVEEESTKPRSMEDIQESIKNSNLGRFQEDLKSTKLFLNNLLRTSLNDTKTKIHVIKTLWK